MKSGNDTQKTISKLLETVDEHITKCHLKFINTQIIERRYQKKNYIFKSLIKNFEKGDTLFIFIVNFHFQCF